MKNKRKIDFIRYDVVFAAIADSIMVDDVVTDVAKT